MSDRLVISGYALSRSDGQEEFVVDVSLTFAPGKAAGVDSGDIINLLRERQDKRPLAEPYALAVDIVELLLKSFPIVTQVDVTVKAWREENGMSVAWEISRRRDARSARQGTSIRLPRPR